MDIHLLPGGVVSMSGASPKPAIQKQPSEGTFQQALSQAAAKPDEISQASTQFEALIIGQVLKAARESSDKGWLGTGDDQTSDMAMEMAEQGLAQGLAAQGGLGIAKMVTAHLRRHEAKAASSEPAAEGPQVPPSKGSVHQPQLRQH
jgi:Rod binding domain-containing protein